MKVSEILDYNRAIKIIIDKGENINGLVKFRLLGMLKQFEPIVENFETVRNNKIVQYGTQKENGDVGIYEPIRENFADDKSFDEAVKKHEEDVKKFNNDIMEILNSEADIEIKKFKYTDVIDAGLPADYLIAIYDLIEE